MHHIYRTKSIILNTFDSGETDKDLILLTSEFGLIKARAQGIRKMSSKLRHALLDYSISDLALVRGKYGFRITNAKSLSNFYFDLKNKKEHSLFVQTLAKIFLLLERLIQGEDFQIEIFDSLEESINFYKKLKLIDFKNEDLIKKIEIITVLKILFWLGYFEKTSKNSDLISEKISLDLIKKIDSDYKDQLIREINIAIKETQL